MTSDAAPSPPHPPPPEATGGSHPNKDVGGDRVCTEMGSLQPQPRANAQLANICSARISHKASFSPLPSLRSPSIPQAVARLPQRQAAYITPNPRQTLPCLNSLHTVNSTCDKVSLLQTCPSNASPPHFPLPISARFTSEMFPFTALDLLMKTTSPGVPNKALVSNE